MTIQNLKVRTRLSLGFGAMVVLVFGVASVGMLKMTQIEQRLEAIVNVNNVETAQVLAMRGTVLDRMVALRNLALLYGLILLVSFAGTCALTLWLSRLRMTDRWSSERRPRRGPRPLRTGPEQKYGMDA